MHELLRYIQLYTECDDSVLKRLEPLILKYIKPKVLTKVVAAPLKRVYVTQKKVDMTIQEFFDNYSIEFCISYDELIKRDRHHDRLERRNKFIREAYQRGFGYSVIGRFLNKDHTTIINAIKKSKL
jgi:hypothetical protein